MRSLSKEYCPGAFGLAHGGVMAPDETNELEERINKLEYTYQKTEVQMLLFPYGKVAKGVGRAVKKVIKPASKTKKVTKLAEPKSAVRVKPARTASGPGLETRGAKLTRSQRSERAAELSFKKLEGRWEGEYLTRMTGLKGPKGVTSQTTRGQGNRSLRKDAAIDKEAKPIIKINSAKPTRPRPAKKSAAQLRPKKK